MCSSDLTSLDLTADIIDVRDIIARVEELEDAISNSVETATEFAEHQDLLKILSDLEGMGGDEQWRGNWYPVTLINNMYFKTYAQELAEEIGAVDTDAKWPNNCIDWDMAARELQHDYSAVDIDGTTYWTR